MKTAIKCGKLFNSNDGTVQENMLVLIDGKKITDVIPCPEQLPQDHEIIDLSDSFVMPGLIDAHVHLGSTGHNDPYSASQALLGDAVVQALENARVNLMAGFTTVRDCGSKGFTHVSVRNAIAQGKFPGSRIFASGGGISSTGGHADDHFSPYLKNTLGIGPCDGPYEARKAARYNLKYGADFIKVMATGGVMSLGTTVGSQQLTQDEMNAICEIARMYGVHTAAHAHGTEGIKAAARAGITSIEHGMMLDDEAIELFLEHGTYHT
ncbi:MAG: amidohydrolase family protein, partial [Clostridia bacterium]|nr:amidohydrolase family protein [Clostridia bacterium]